MKQRTWLIVSIALIAAATALMLLSEEKTPEREDVDVRLPRYANKDEQSRMRQRRTLPVLPVAPVAQGEAAAPVRPQDPVLAAIASGRGSAIVVEANAIRHSPIGELLLQCLASSANDNPIEQVKTMVGIDPLKDLDRVAMTEDGLVLSGKFGEAKWSELFKGRASTRAYGDQGTIYELPAGTDGKSRGVFVTWGPDFAMMSDTPEAARATIDRLEGRAAATPVLTEEQTYGEIYGVISAEDLASLFPKEQSDLAERFRQAASRVELHVDTTRDVGVVARVDGQDASMVSDLGKSMGAALSLARMQAKAQGENELVEFMDYAKVRPDDGKFALELALPMEVLERQLAWCKDEKLREERRAKRQAEREARRNAQKDGPATPEGAEDDGSGEQDPERARAAEYETTETTFRAPPPERPAVGAGPASQSQTAPQ